MKLTRFTGPAVKFDVAATKIVGKLPKSLHPAFDVLGYLTMPPAWMALIAAVAVIEYYQSGNVSQFTLYTLLLIPLASVLKLFIKRKRPPTIYADGMRIKSYSFPSGHAYSAALSAGYFAVIAAHNSMHLLAAATVILAGVIGLSRIHLGAHYPSDVLGGWLLGAGVLAVILAMA